jgi:hypothetical protein
MGEEHSSRVEVGKSLQPVRVVRKRLFHAVKSGPAGQLVRRELGCEVVSLAGKDHGAVVSPKDND